MLRARACMRVGCVSRGSGGSSVQHVPGKFCHRLGEERRREGEERREGRKKGETDGGRSGEWRAIKRGGKRGI